MMERKTPHLIVITGGIGAGKSTVLAKLKALGHACVDADDIAHGLYTPDGEATVAIARHFGAEILSADGTPNRRLLAAKVFGNETELAWLNGLVHPLVRKRIDEAARAVASKPLFAAIPLWYESGWQMEGTTVIAVWCSRETQLARLRQRGWSDDEIARRLATQLSMDEKYARADYGIVTDCSLERLEEQVAEVARRVTEGAGLR